MATESENQGLDKKTDEQPTIPNVDKFWVSVLALQGSAEITGNCRQYFSTKESTKGKDNVDKDVITAANKAEKETVAAEVKAEKDTAAAEVKADKETAAAEVKADKAAKTKKQCQL